MPRKIEATVTPELYNLLKAETKKRGRRLHAVAGELLLERLTLEAAPATPETLSTSAAPRSRRGSRRGSGSSAPRTASPSNEPAGRTEDTSGPGSSD